MPKWMFLDFYVSKFLLPWKAIKKAEATCRDLLWGASHQYHRRTLIAYSLTKCVKTKKGLGFKILRTWNQAVIATNISYCNKELYSWVKGNDLLSLFKRADPVVLCACYWCMLVLEGDYQGKGQVQPLLTRGNIRNQLHWLLTHPTEALRGLKYTLRKFHGMNELTCHSILFSGWFCFIISR